MILFDAMSGTRAPLELWVSTSTGSGDEGSIVPRGGVEKSEEDLPAQCSAGRDDARPRHESEETPRYVPARSSAGSSRLGEFIEACYWKRFGAGPLDPDPHKREPGSPKLVTPQGAWTRLIEAAKETLTGILMAKRTQS
jgi:hypothetical protein